MRHACLLFLLAAATPALADSPPEGRLPQNVIPTHYQLSLRIDPRANSFSGETRIEVTLRQPASSLWLHGHGLKVSAVSVSAGGHSIAAHYEEVEHSYGVARISADAPIPAGAATLTLTYSAPFQDTDQGLYHTRVRQDWYAFTQMEATDARRAFPGFDEPGFKTPFDISITARSTDKVVTNTPEVRSQPAGAGWVRHQFEVTRPLPTYLLAFVVGPLDIVELPAVPANAVRHTPLPLRIVATHGEASRTAFAGREAPHLIQRLEEYFGIAFPYAKLDLIASPLGGGAMENAGAIIFDDSLLLFGEHPTDAEQATFGTVAAHEMAHQWFGDLVTPAWWDDIWLNESFAEWMGVKIADAWRPDLGIATEQLGRTLRAMNTDALRTGRPIHQPITSTAQINSTFDDITYEKGAGVLGMIESYLGEARFRKGVQLHLQKHPYGTATAAEFFAAMAQGSGDPGVTEAFRSFVDQAGVPLIKVGAQGSVLSLGQSRYRPLGSGGSDSELWKVPVCVDAISAAQHAKSCTLLSGRSGTLTLGTGVAGAVLHPNAGGAGYYRFDVDAQMFRALVAAAPQLPAREALSFADSVGAAFDAGRLSFADLLAAAAVLARHPDRSAALNLGNKLLAIRDVLASPAERPAIERRLVQMYKPRLQGLGFDPAAGRYASESGEQRLLRESLVSLVALGGRDAQVRAALATAAQRSLTDPKALDAGLRHTAWSVAVQEQGQSFAAKIEPLVFSSPDPHVRRDAAAALGNAQSAPVADEARALVLDKRADVTDSLVITMQQVRDPVTRAATWSWLSAHREAVLARVPEFFQADLAKLGTYSCSAEELKEFDSVLGERLSKASGGELQVGRAREHIGDCIALRQAIGAQLQAALVR